MQDIVRRGRKKGIGCTLITQRPAVLSKDVLTQCEVLCVLRLVHPVDGYVSPRLGVRFEAPGDRELVVHRPDGQPFRTPLEIRQAMERAESERDSAQAERDRLAAKLRELGVDPERF